MKNPKFLLVLFAFICLAHLVIAQAPLRARNFNLDKGLAIQGYDPVAYFTQHKAVKGDKQITTTVDGITYRFSTQADKDLFNKNAKAYEPQYGGWCAFAMGSSGEKVEIDPETFKIIDGKLFLFYHTWTNNTLIKWNKEEVKLKTNADKNWANIFK